MDRKTARQVSFGGIQWRTVTQAVHRWAGDTHMPRGRLTFRILRELSQDIDLEVVPGILRETV